jgi:hypothetical protein
MKKLFLPPCFLFLVALGNLSASCNDYYLSFFGAANFKPSEKERKDGFKLRWHYDTGYFAAGALGFRVGDFRMEGELGYR